VPLCYAVSFSLAYTGPNASVMGNVGNSYYHYTAVSSLEGNLLSLVQFLVVMLATLVVCSTILYCAASINVAKVYLHIMKEYGWPFAFQQAFIVFTLFCSIAVACGFDWTFGFLWLQGETGLEWMQDLADAGANATATLTDTMATTTPASTLTTITAAVGNTSTLA